MSAEPTPLVRNRLSAQVLALLTAGSPRSRGRVVDRGGLTGAGVPDRGGEVLARPGSAGAARRGLNRRGLAGAGVLDWGGGGPARRGGRGGRGAGRCRGTGLWGRGARQARKCWSSCRRTSR